YGWGLIDLRRAIEGPGQIRVDTEVVMNQRAGGAKVWEGLAWDDWTNDIGGDGRLTKSGIGWLRLSGDNTFGGLTVKQGVLELDGDNALGGDV
ncbi:autotransporter-associated beta strand repeat-containing protein, partial [Acinetobacter baumannii]